MHRSPTVGHAERPALTRTSRPAPMESAPALSVSLDPLLPSCLLPKAGQWPLFPKTPPSHTCLLVYSCLIVQTSRIFARPPLACLRARSAASERLRNCHTPGQACVQLIALPCAAFSQVQVLLESWLRPSPLKLRFDSAARGPFLSPTAATAIALAGRSAPATSASPTSESAVDACLLGSAAAGMVAACCMGGVHNQTQPRNLPWLPAPFGWQKSLPFSGAMNPCFTRPEREVHALLTIQDAFEQQVAA